MSIIRKYNYTNGTKSNGTYLNEEFDQVYANQNQNQADTTTAKSDAATAKADSATALSTANAADTKATTALSTANTAAANATTALNTANAATTTANNAQTSASAAATSASNAQAAAQAAEIEAENAASAVADKADVAYVDQVAANFTMGIVGNDSIVDAKLKQTGNNILPNFNAHLLDKSAHGLGVATTVNPAFAFGMNSKITSLATIPNPLSFSFTGKTQLNLLGKDGNCEDVTKWSTYQVTPTLDATNKVFGTNGIKVAISSGSSGNLYKALSGILAMDVTKYYFMSAYLKNGNATNISLGKDNSGGGLYKTSSNITDNSKFSRVGFVVQPSDIAAGNLLCVSINGSAGQYGFVDGIQIQEITSAEYALGSTAMLDKYPYNDSYACLTNPYIEVRHDNLVRNGNCEDGIGYWSLGSGTNATIVVENGKFKLTSNLTYSYFLQRVKVKPNTDYYLKANVSGTGAIRAYNADMSGGSIRGGTGTFNSGANSEIIIAMHDAGATGTTYFDSVQLVEGTVAPASYKPCRVERTMIEGNFTDQDTVALADGDVSGLLLWKHKTVYGRDFDWVYVGDYTGFKTIKAFVEQPSKLPGSGVYNQNLIKYNGDVLKYNGSTNTVNSFLLYNTDGGLYNCVADADTGWAESIAPNNNEVKAFMNGWKATLNNGTRYLLWQSVKDGSVPQGAVQATVSAGYTGLTIPVVANGTAFANGDPVYCISSTGSIKWSDSVSGSPTATTIPIAGSKTVVTGDIIVKADNGSTNVGMLMWCVWNVAPGYEGYKIHYRLANPEPITDTNVHLHGDIPKIDTGDNYVFVDTGGVLDEVNIPYYDSGNSRYSINSGTFLKNKIENINAVYRNRLYDSNWIYSASYAESRGNGFSYSPVATYDVSAIYTVDYKMIATEAPNIGTIVASYGQDVYTAILKMQEQIENKQNRDSAIDSYIDSSLYEKGIVTNAYTRGVKTYYNLPNETLICIPIKMSPKKTRPVITTSDLVVTTLGSTGVPDAAVLSTEADGGNPEIWSITKTDFVLAFVIKPGTKADNAIAYGANVAFKWTADCRGRV